MPRERGVRGFRTASFFEGPGTLPLWNGRLQWKTCCHFFDIETATPMNTWGGTRRIYENLAAGFRDRIYLNRTSNRGRTGPTKPCLVTGLAAARQLGADYPFDDPAAKRWFNYFGSIPYGSRFRKAC